MSRSQGATCARDLQWRLEVRDPDDEDAPGTGRECRGMFEVRRDEQARGPGEAA
jgi:hypothetical protein